MNDLQAAIDHFRLIIDATNTDSRYNIGFVDGLEFCINHLSTMPSTQPPLDEWCTDCKEYDKEKHCCPRWNRVIRETLKDAQPERKKGHWVGCDGELKTMCKCSECGAMIDINEKYRNFFCYHCGAKMEDANG